MKIQHDKAKSIFLMRRGNRRGRGAGPVFVDAQCAGDHTLRAEVEEFRHHERLGAFLQPVPGGLPTNLAAPPLGGFGWSRHHDRPLQAARTDRRRRFRLVFMAEQQKPVRRKVAVKILKPGMDSRQVIARSRPNARRLALMDHPHIAKVLDAGRNASGRPYFAMELISGIPITDYCDQEALRRAAAWSFSLTICQAVQHAHHKGIIHRDLKPSNVLVTLHDGPPVVKVIDFGIAKALGQQLTDKTLYTGFAQMIGTLCT